MTLSAGFTQHQTQISNQNQTPFQSSPAALADVLNPLDEQRDSAYFSSASTNGDQSKHNSLAHPTQTNSLISPRTSNYQCHSPSESHSMTPSPINLRPNQPFPSPTTSGGMPLTTMVTSPNPITPTEASSMDASMLAKLNTGAPAPPHTYTLTAPNSTRASIVSQTDSFTRRDSVDGQINNTFGGLRLNSPYASANQSTTSIQSTLQQQRNPGHLSASSAGGRLSETRFNSYIPHRFGGPRTAPTITGPAAAAVANAEEPTRGQAWAFPDEMSGSQGDANTIGSRRSSIAESMASSQFTESSRLPPGQRRLDDGFPGGVRSSLSMEFQNGQNGPLGVQHHHHTLQHRKLGELKDEEGTSPNASGSGNAQPYSRTPELRKSHKMAERKRRNEMKELYDELKDLLPTERGSKSSKYEILTKSIQEHRHQRARYTELENFCKEMDSRHAYDVQRSNRDKVEMQSEISRQRDEINELRAELRELRALARSGGGFGLGGVPQSDVSFSSQGAQSDSSYPHANGMRRESVLRNEPSLGSIQGGGGGGLGLPPLRSVTSEVGIGMRSGGFVQNGGGEAMSGVQYGSERVGGFGGGFAR